MIWSSRLNNLLQISSISWFKFVSNPVSGEILMSECCFPTNIKWKRKFCWFSQGKYNFRWLNSLFFQVTCRVRSAWDPTRNNRFCLPLFSVFLLSGLHSLLRKYSFQYSRLLRVYCFLWTQSALIIFSYLYWEAGVFKT